LSEMIRETDRLNKKGIAFVWADRIRTSFE